MKILRHILSHLMFLLLMACLVSVFYFREQIMPGEFVDKVEYYANKVHPRLVAFKSEPLLRIDDVAFKQPNESNDVAVLQANDVKHSVEEQQVIVVEEPVEEMAGKAEVEKSELAEQIAITSMASNNEPEIEPADKTETVEDVPVSNDAVSVAETVNAPMVETEEAKKVHATVNKETTEEVVAVVAVEKPENQKTQVFEVAEAIELSSDKQAADYKKILHQARDAYNNKNIEVAINKYKELIELEGQQADFHGELGNIYYAKGDWSQAAEMYYQAAVRLIDEKHFTQVTYLQRVLQGLSQQRAEQLANKMAANHR